MAPLTCTKLSVITITGVIIQIIGLSLFVFGFFPVKPALPGTSGSESFYAPTCDFVGNLSDTTLPSDQLKSLYQELSGIPPSFDRLILMVIDGLPAEFVLGKNGKPPNKQFKEGMPYTQSLLASGSAIGYHAKAAPPTVTMPRLKAMVSGAIGGFLDVAFNFNTQAMMDDNLLGQFFRIGWKMVMLGDETWIKLFPRLFERHDGVSSFYVKDTVQVDQNVSRHLGDELWKDDWNLLILHYLGLDHVGHIGGRSSVLMVPKLKEMDEVVKLIHSSINQSQGNRRGRALLVIVSDHGMTENGNHGGSTYEETDSLALFIGLRNHVFDYAPVIKQIDIAPTLALLFGVPIPKNNVGVMIREAFDSLKEDQHLRALELNAWQLLRLLHAQLSGLPCRNFPCDAFYDHQSSDSSECNHTTENMLCCLYMEAAALYTSWKSKRGFESSSNKDYRSTAAAYYKFLKSASEWLSRRTTDKPVKVLVLGLATMFISSVMLSNLMFCRLREIYHGGKQQASNLNDSMNGWSFDETFIISVVLILVTCMTSSSMVEEEHYIWYFFISTFYLLLLRKTAQSLSSVGLQSSFPMQKGKSGEGYFRICCIFLLLISGRILRGWHQGGVNWTSLPDISKWLEQAGSQYVKPLQLISAILVISIGLFALFSIESKGKYFQMVRLIFLISGLLVLLHITRYQDFTFSSTNYGATLLVQIIYAILGATTIGTVVALPWLIPLSTSKISPTDNTISPPFFPSIQEKFPLVEFRDSLYVIGWAYILCWCLLQLLLQQPINTTPILLLLLQTVASVLYFLRSGTHHKEWVEIAGFYYLGMAGHFALGNSNTLATIDVAGAFIGISNHSTFLSGILMFVITYASPMFILLSLVMCISTKSMAHLVIPEKENAGDLLMMMLGFPCLVPLVINSILLTAYTVVLLLMQNHLFVWSVFSPKYLYVCATTVCTFIGVFIVAATGSYTYFVLAKRKQKACTRVYSTCSS
ncbi:GPI ethanolamine phosphate transferase 2-like isoform X2 [Hibiscus syriacus]|uniref:GPI ethanolamine phosphate transferase 2-like isoform X2 n=1 Tax=Hibiscus syriacus TaxID=106335 RepID=A0A6A3ARQ2_HIBSY|nr:GPI ethanolamine phosphate transferase 2-like isoform X3 [Hibiscus syriacus]KAE8706946.1 GPI ethanolamine phosphate transferase 2-like isoform X2 [Hibiscus syriacus]